MPSAKSVRPKIKKTENKKNGGVGKKDDELIPDVGARKIPTIIDIIEEIIEPADKIDDDPLIPIEETDEDELGLDSEEIDPFEDKWEQ